MELLDDSVWVWVARIFDRRDESAITVWSSLTRAQEWCAHELGADISWDSSPDENPQEPIDGYVADVRIVEIRCAEVMDPVALVERYPSTLPPARYILDDESS